MLYACMHAHVIQIMKCFRQTWNCQSIAVTLLGQIQLLKPKKPDHQGSSYNHLMKTCNNHLSCLLVCFLLVCAHYRPNCLLKKSEVLYISTSGSEKSLYKFFINTFTKKTELRSSHEVKLVQQC